MSDNEPNRTVYLIGGPTAVGKSDVALYLAKRIDGEIVNCDSVQLYKHMDIGSAMPTRHDRSLVPHHLFDFIEPDYNMTVAEYQKLALDVIDDILARGKTPVVVGGTGLYMNSILYDMDFAARPVDEARRAELEELAEESGAEYMYDYLSAIDPDAASRIHPNNVRKVVRAIEAWESGSGIKDMDELQLNPNYDFKLFGLTMDRTWLYDRINRRVLKLLEAGFVDEVRTLREMGLTKDSPAMKAIGYRELFAYLNDECTLKDAAYEIMKNTRHYAKRQLTWLKRYDDIHWIEIVRGETVGQVIDDILQY